MSKSAIQNEIRAMQKYREEANKLIEKLNASTKDVNTSADMEIKRIKERIEKDLKELSQYVSDDVPSTKSLSMYHHVEKQGDYPIANFMICFDGKNHGVNESVGLTEYKISIVEHTHTYAAVYGDGLWADDYPDVSNRRNWGKNRTINDVIEILCRNWNTIIEGAYEIIKQAYKEDAEKKLKDALQKEEKSILRHEVLSKI